MNPSVSVYFHLITRIQPSDAHEMCSQNIFSVPAPHPNHKPWLRLTPRFTFITSLISSKAFFFFFWWLFLHAALLHVSGLGYLCCAETFWHRQSCRLNVAWCFGYCGEAWCHLALEHLEFTILHVNMGIESLHKVYYPIFLNYYRFGSYYMFAIL